MIISGVQQFTMLDYPNKHACIVFTAGCNFRCGYCHNPEFVLPEQLAKIKDSFIPEEAIFSFLQRRVGLLDGVVISGGEPTMMPDLVVFAQKVKDMGFLVKLDTNGNKPEVLKKLYDKDLLDYVAMDVKMSLASYCDVVGNRANPEAIAKSMDMIKQSGLPYEFRTTLVPNIHTPKVLDDMKELLTGSKLLFLQTFRPSHTLDPGFGRYQAFSDAQMQHIRSHFADVIDEVHIRV